MAPNHPSNSGGPPEFMGHILLDVPAQNPSLKIDSTARALATIVTVSDPRFAVGIFGGWGSGKSTLMEEIERIVDVEEDVIVVRFNAWRYEREAHLIVPLLDTIRAAVAARAIDPRRPDDQKQTLLEIARTVGRVVRALARTTTLQVGLPGMVTLGVEPGKVVDELVTRPDDAESRPQSLYFAAFEELADAFGKVSAAGISRLLVFVDDLDRCLPEQALSVLESMKLFFDMPGFIFVVGLDDKVLEAAVRTKFSTGPGLEGGTSRYVEGEYLKKMFQVPYSLPPMFPEQLPNLLDWIRRHGQLSAGQLHDLDRVEKYLGYVVTQGRINPREVKRFINTYTLRRMIRGELDPDATLALQAIEFRGDWESFYDQVILSEPALFADALVKFRGGDDLIFEDLWPEISVLPFDLSFYLRSLEADILTRVGNLEVYISSLESTRGLDSWMAESLGHLGGLRRQVREIDGRTDIGSPASRELASHMKSKVELMQSQVTSHAGIQPAEWAGLTKNIESLIQMISRPGHAPDAPPLEGEMLERTRDNALRDTAAIQSRILRLRRSSGKTPA
jgi:hypothetical protein